MDLEKLRDARELADLADNCERYLHHFADALRLLSGGEADWEDIEWALFWAKMIPAPPAEARRDKRFLESEAE